MFSSLTILSFTTQSRLNLSCKQKNIESNLDESKKGVLEKTKKFHAFNLFTWEKELKAFMICNKCVTIVRYIK